MCGREVQLPIEQMFGGASCPGGNTLWICYTFTEAAGRSLSWVRVHLHQALQHQKQCYDRKSSGGRYKVGDSVLYSPAVSRGKAAKFHRPWRGPYRVVKVLSDVIYRIQLVSPTRRDRPRNYRLVVHFNRLKPCPPARELSTFNTWVQYWDFQYWGYSTTGNHWMCNVYPWVSY